MLYDDFCVRVRYDETGSASGIAHLLPGVVSYSCSCCHYLTHERRCLPTTMVHVTLIGRCGLREYKTMSL